MDTSLKQSLKAKAHHLKPVVLLGAKGLTPSVIEEINVALQAHELIKIKISGAEREDKHRIIQELCMQLNADLVQVVGHTATLYRANAEA